MRDDAHVTIRLPPEGWWELGSWGGPRRSCFQAFRTHDGDAGIYVQQGDKTVALLGFDEGCWVNSSSAWPTPSRSSVFRIQSMTTGIQAATIESGSGGRGPRPLASTWTGRGREWQC